jgi:hypothetical protein
VGTVLGDVSPSDDTSIQFKDVPVEALEVTTRVGTKVFRRALEAGVETVSVNLPTSGQLRVHFEAIPSIASSKGEMILKVQDPQDATQVPVEQIDAFQASETGGWDQVANLLPGTYTVRVLVNTDASAPAGSDATRTLFEGPVTITAGEETLIVVTGGANPTAAIRTR